MEFLKCTYHQNFLNASTHQACFNWGSFIWSLESLFKSKQQKALQTSAWTFTRRPSSLPKSFNGVCLKLLKTKSRTTSAAGRLRADCVLWHQNRRREKKRDSECMTGSLLFKWIQSSAWNLKWRILHFQDRNKNPESEKRCVPQAT